MVSSDDDLDQAVADADDRFYAAFEAGDIDAMSDLWDHSADIVCTHPGWPRLRGWSQISGSWVKLFAGAQRIQFILLDREIVRVGDVAIVTEDENLLGASGPATVSTINIYRHTNGVWLMIAHHGSQVG